MTATDVFSDTEHEPPRRRPGELDLRELLRFSWRQLTSMRTALVLLLLLALAAVPGSVIPQQDVDSLDATRWKEAHETLTPIYERLGLFDVYGSPWFAAIYLLLVASLVGCIVPRTLVYARAIRKPPPAAPRNLTRLPDHTTYRTDVEPAAVLAAARAELKRRGYRLRAEDDATAVSAERGYLREVGNLLFHLAVLVVLVGFALGGLFGYKGGVILVTGTPFGNTPTQYDDFVPGSLFQAGRMDDFTFTVDDFDVEWMTDGPRMGMARNFNADVRYREGDGEEQQYDLRVNHPLKIGSTELFLIGHGYAPVVTIRDANGDVAFRGHQVFLPQAPDLLSFGVIKAPDAQPEQIGFEGFLYPSFVMTSEGDPANLYGAATNPLLSLNVYKGDLNMDAGGSQSVYVLDKSKAEPLPGKAGQPYRVDLRIGQTVELPDGLGTITFDDLYSWQRIQISQTPGKQVALAGVVLALVGLMGSLFIRSRRVWVRATATGSDGGATTLVEVAGLERSGGGDVRSVLDDLVKSLQEKDTP